MALLVSCLAISLIVLAGCAGNEPAVTTGETTTGALGTTDQNGTTVLTTATVPTTTTTAPITTTSGEVNKPEDDTMRILFLGNSLMFYNDMPETFRKMANAAGKNVYIQTILDGGSTIAKYADHPCFKGLYVSLEALFEQADILSLHCPLTEETHHLINADAIGRMKEGVVIVNTSRGALVNTEDLIQGIKSGKVGAACLDVYEEEGEVFYEDLSGHIVQDDKLVRLIAMPNVIVTSHQAFLTREALDNIACTTVNNLVKFFHGQPDESTEVAYRK